MAMQSPYKSYNRGRRTADIETDFSSGMYFTNGVIDEGYMKTLVNFDIAEDKRSLSSRPGLRVSEFCDANGQIPLGFLENSVEIFAAKDCVENNHNYRQIIFGDLDSGMMFVATINLEDKEVVVVSPENEVPLDSLDPEEIFEKSKQFIETYGANTGDYIAKPSFEDFTLSFLQWLGIDLHSINMQATAFEKVHDLAVDENAVHYSLIGCFGFNNSYYFIKGTQTTVGYNLLWYTQFDPDLGYYVIHPVDEKTVTAAEAVTYGYNMLSQNPYVFSDTSGGSSTFQMQGILPYSASYYNDGELMMTPKRNQNVWFRCYYDVPTGDPKYKVVWEWKELTADEWIPLSSAEITFTSTSFPVLEVPFKPPSENIMIRVSVYLFVNGVVNTTVETAMTVGFDFTVDEHGTVSNLEQTNYDLSTATGIVYWKNRLVLYGVPADPTVLFISDLNEPSYFPYPNNITVLDQPIVRVLEFMGNLIAFTTDKVYQITLDESGTSWNADVIQTNLRINAADKHLILPVRNMLFFKSGDYYYMMVPKATSTTGELTLAPISNPITELFKNFHNTISDIFKYVYGSDDDFTLLDCYNFLDYDDVHNIYVFHVDNYDGYIHFDVIYNTMDRTWRIYIFQTAHKIFPILYDATQSGVFGLTAVSQSSEQVSNELIRCVEFLKFDSKNAKDFYIPTTSIAAVLDDPEDALRELILSDEEQYGFRNYQFVDTGYRNNNPHLNKRFRELQFQINNIDKEELEFGFEFLIDGENRLTYFRYDVEQVIDETDSDYGLVYLEPVPIMNIPIDEYNIIPDELDFKMNHWKLGASPFPEISLWKVRVPVSGKGMVPRVKLLSCNESRLNVFSLNWVYRTMYMR